MTQLILQPNAAAGIDTGTIGGGASTRNYGIAPSMGWGTGASLRKPLVKFDCSSIPAGATCTAATFYGYHAVQGAANAWTVTIYSIAIGNAAWIEGTQINAQALAGEPCWDALAADGAGGVLTPWAGSAGLSTAITDYEAAALGTFSGNRSDAVDVEYSAALTPARVQGWFGGINTNYGIVLVGSSNDIGGIWLSDHSAVDLTRCPKLVIDYTLPGGGYFRHAGRWFV